MNIDFLKKLSDADGIAGNESEVRTVILDEIASLKDGLKIQTDGLGSLILTKKGTSDKSVMLCGHMDEVGFMVRNIAENGLIGLMVVGGVKPHAQQLQSVRITTFSGTKYFGFIQGKFENGLTSELYCDIGANSAKEVAGLGIEIGNMVAFDADFQELGPEDTFAGKALDDRLGCFVLGELIKELKDVELPLTVHFAFTSSEEVGIRGAKTAAQMMNPDAVFVVDVATYSSDWIRDHNNQRQLGKGPILTHFDRTLSPNQKMSALVRETAKALDLPLQLDMFTTGGTDGGEAHKVNEGKPTVVSILPVRNGHCAYSIMKGADIEQMITLYSGILQSLTLEKLQDIKTYI